MLVQEENERTRKSLLLSPLIFAANLVFLLGSEIILDIKGLANLLGRLALDHVGNGLAADIQQGLDVQVVRSLWNVVSQYLPTEKKAAQLW